jgi:hypothetical protein
VASGKCSVTNGVVDGIGLPLTRRGPIGSPTSSNPSSNLRPSPPGRAFSFAVLLRFAIVCNAYCQLC